MQANSLQDLYELKLQQTLDAEEQVMDAAPHLAQEVQNEQLRSTLQQHIRQSDGQVERLRQVMKNRGIDAKSKECISMRAMIKEAQTMLKNIGDPDTRDAFIISAQQGIEHHEIASYGTLRTWAQQLGYSGDARILQQTLDEEGQADKMLSSIAERRVNPEASQGADHEVGIASGGQGDRSRSGELGAGGGISGGNVERGADMR
ncbi:MAG TPA: ferritin-like domain-containing protein [Gemmatimonadaceae bacterium]|jgi:ferritin-like metal-binding protein YciE|nr:ferritin-like domain-containing protein [Gemmatimonadaceae bacterium]